MPVDAMINLSLWLRKYIDLFGKVCSVFILPLVFVTMYDVFLRKLGGFQYYLYTHLGSAFESTKIQEWEWHFHTMLFCFVLGYGFVNNRHVRVDLVREKMSGRMQAWVEFLGCTFALLPYCLIVAWFALAAAINSYQINEVSASLVGLGHRWAIRSVLVIGLLVAAAAGFAVWLQSVIYLFGPKEVRFELMTLNWPEDLEKLASRARARKSQKADEKTARADAKADAKIAKADAKA